MGGAGRLGVGGKYSPKQVLDCEVPSLMFFVSNVMCWSLHSEYFDYLDGSWQQ